MARMNRELAVCVRDLLESRRFSETSYRLPRGVTTSDLVNLVTEALDEDVKYFAHADELVWNVARHQGYIIPACPVESRGDAHEFLKEFGVKNAREWYAKHGLAEEDEDGFYGRSCIMVRNKKFWRKLIEVPAVEQAMPAEIVPALLETLDFALGEETSENDPTLFIC